MSITAPADTQPSAAGRVGVRTPAELLDAAGRADLKVRLAEAEKLDLAAQWADANPVTEHNPLPARLHHRGDEIPTHPGLTQVTASAVADFAARCAISTHAGTSLIADALEIRARLPRVWDLTMAGQFHLWRARALAQTTCRLNQSAVDWIDRQAAIAGLNLGPVQLDELVLRATAMFDPDKLPADDQTTYVRIEPDRLSTSGMANLDGRLSGLDAADLDAALQAEATVLSRTGDAGNLDQRRAAALGNIARAALGQDTLLSQGDFSHGKGGGEVNPAAATPTEQVMSTEPVRQPTRKLSLYAFLSAASLGIGGGCELCADSTLASAPNLGTLLTPQAIRDWCGNPDLHVTVTPVIDTSANLHTEADVPGPTMQAQVALRDRHCVFPFCHRPAHPQPRSTGQADRPDLDHIEPRSTGGPTSSENLACLCRRHHRLKTFTGWRYRQLDLTGTYLRTSPTGTRYLRTRITTINLDQPDRVGHSGPEPDQVLPEHRATVDRARERIQNQTYRAVPPPDAHGDPPDQDPDPPPF